MNEAVVRDRVVAADTVEVTMPSTGTDAPVSVVIWLTHPGAAVSQHEALCIVDWGAGSAEVACPVSGTLRMLAAGAGQQVRPGETLAVVDTATKRRGRFAQEWPPA